MNYSNSQRAGVILYLAASLFGGYLISEENNTEISIYGKTGMGKAEGIVVDAWFTGFAETLEGNKYFCVYLGQSDAGNTSSTAAKEIAIQILNDNK